MNLFIEQKPTHRLRERTCGCQGRRVKSRDSLGVWVCLVHTPVFKMDDQQGPTAQHRELSVL